MRPHAKTLSTLHYYKSTAGTTVPLSVNVCVSEHYVITHVRPNSSFVIPPLLISIIFHFPDLFSLFCLTT